MPTAVSHPERDKAWSMPLEQIDVSKGYLFEQDIVGFYFERLRQRRPGPLRGQQALRSVLVGDQVQGHHGGRRQPRDLLLGGDPRRHLAGRAAGGRGVSEFHRDGPAEARRAAQDRQPDRRARQPGPARSARSASALRRILDGLPRRRDVRLGGAGVDRTDHADAGDAVRLSVRGPAAADLVVGHGHRRPGRQRPGDILGAAARRARQVPGVLHPPVERARQRPAAQRPDLDARARAGHARTWAQTSSWAT